MVAAVYNQLASNEADNRVKRLLLEDGGEDCEVVSATLSIPTRQIRYDAAAEASPRRYRGTDVGIER